MGLNSISIIYQVCHFGNLSSLSLSCRVVIKINEMTHVCHKSLICIVTPSVPSLSSTHMKSQFTISLRHQLLKADETPLLSD